MTRIIDGVEFHVETPSVLYLAAAPVVIAYNGTTWVMECPDPRGGRMHRQFASRDAAIAMIREAWSNAG